VISATGQYDEPRSITTRWVGWSRVYLGVHWATDVVAGWLIGTVWVVTVASLGARARAPREKRHDARPPETHGISS